MEIPMKCKKDHVVLINRCDLVDLRILIFYPNFEEILGKFLEIMGKYCMFDENLWGLKG